MLFGQVYDRLKAMAGRQLGAGQHTLDATALVHELYLRIGSDHDLVFAHPNQFFTYAARAMRHLLADRARDRLRQRASGDWIRTPLTGSDWRFALDSAEQALDLDEAMQKLAAVDARAAQVVELLCFAGLRKRGRRNYTFETDNSSAPFFSRGCGRRVQDMRDNAAARVRRTIAWSACA
jgi:RNA polymerase sigma factor (TIGR02999 family)